MKSSFWVLLLFLLLMSAGTCSRPPVDEEPAEVQVLGIYPYETNHYFIPLIKSKYVDYNYLDSLIFLHIDSSGTVLRAPAYPLISRPNIDNIYYLNNQNIILNGTFSSDEYYFYSYGSWEMSPEAELLQNRTFPDRMSALCPLSDGNILYFGLVPGDSIGREDLRYMNIDPDGDTLWQRQLALQNSIYIRGGVPLPDRECIALGNIWTSERSYDMFAAYINAAGDTLWTRSYGGDRYDDFHSGILLSDGDFLLAGRLDLYDSTNTDWSLSYGQQVYLIRVAPDGGKRWSHPYGTTLREMPVDILENSDGSISLLGLRDESYAYLYDVPTGWVLRMDPDGETLHMAEFPSRIPAGMCELPSGNTLIAASRIAEDMYYQYMKDLSLIKVSPSGTRVWDLALTP